MRAEPAQSSTILTRSFAAGDEAQILHLFAQSFHVRRSLEEWRWRYESDPFGRHHISLSFDSAGRLIAQYAGYPVVFRHQSNGPCNAHQIGDTMTAVEARHLGRGPSSVLGRTAEHFYETFCRRSVAFNYGFNTANIQRFSVRFLGSTRVEDVPYRTLDLGGGTLRRQSRLVRRLLGYSLELVSTLDEAEWTEFFDRVADDYAFLVRRDAAYLRWRYLQPAWLNYIVVAIRRWGLLVGWSVFRIVDDRLFWGDALFDARHPGSVEVLLRHVGPLFGGNGARRLAGWFPDRPHWFGRTLDSLGFIRVPEPQGLALMCVPFERPEAAEMMARSLYYTGGDSDLF
jgi:hypothetical protein